MSERRRLRRRDPERTAPRRSAERTDDPNSFDRWNSEDASPQAPYSDSDNHRHRADEDLDPWRFEARNDHHHADADAWRRPGNPPDDPVTAGVRLGYQVIEEHIRQGQRVARQIADHDYRLGDMSDDAWEFLQRAIRYSEDLAAQGFELLFSLSRLRPNAFSHSRSFDRQPRGNPWSHPRRDAGSSAWSQQRASPFDSEDNRRPHQTPPRSHRPTRVENGFAIEVTAQIPVAVKLDLAPGAGHDLEITELRCCESDEAPLQEVAPLQDVWWTTVGPIRKLRVRVDPDQPVGVYVGPLVDLYGHERGRLTVHVGEPGDESDASTFAADASDTPIAEPPFGTD